MYCVRMDDVDDVILKELEANGGFASNETRQTAHVFRCGSMHEIL